MRFSNLFTAMAISLLSISWLCGSGIPGNDGAQHFPTIAELEKISFTEVKLGPSGSSPAAEVRAARDLFVAYRGGSNAISKYREPVETRGPRGVALFKTVADYSSPRSSEDSGLVQFCVFERPSRRPKRSPIVSCVK
jgi:hypothetical protein